MWDSGPYCVAVIGSSGLNLREGVLLGHALVDGLARQLGVRALIIKGPRQVGLGLKPDRASVDTDALIDPAEFSRMLSALEDLGWARRVPDTSPHVLPFHSVAVAHVDWPCEIDIHHHYPGFFAPDEMVFDALWLRHRTDLVAGREVAVCDLAGDTLIAALHAARAPSSKQSDYDFLVASVRRRFDSEQLRDVAVLAAETGAADTLRGFLDDIGAPAIGKGQTSADVLYAWSLLTAGEQVRGIGWVDELRRAPWRQRSGLLWRAIWLNEPEVRDQYPQAPAGFLGLCRAQWWRWKATAPHLPRAVRMLRTARKG